MLRRSRIFRHLFLDVAKHPNLIFRSLVKVLAHNRVNVTDALRRQGTPPAGEAFAVPVEYTVFMNPDDFRDVAASREESVPADLSEQFAQFLKTPVGRVYDTPYLDRPSFRLAIDTELGLERNEYYFAWVRNPLVGVLGRLDLFVRGKHVESFDVPTIPALGIGTARNEHVRLDRVTDAEVALPHGVSLWVTHEAGRLTLLNRGRPGAFVLVDTVAVPPNEAVPLYDGSRIAIGPDLTLAYTAERPLADGASVVRQPTREDIEEVLGLLGVQPAVEASGDAAVAVPRTVPAASPTGTVPGARPSRRAPVDPAEPAHRISRRARRALTDAGSASARARLDLIGSVLTTQMFEHVPGGTLCLGSSPRCHIVLRGAGIRPVHAELALSEGRIYLGNRSGRHAVHHGPLDAPVRRGDRCLLALGDPVRLGGLRLRLEPPFCPIDGDIAAFFGANYIGNLILSEPQAGLEMSLEDSRPITIGRDQTCDWVLTSPYLWPTHAEVLPRGGPRIRPAAGPRRGGRAMLFVNMQAALERGQSHTLRTGDHIVVGNLILRYMA